MFKAGVFRYNPGSNWGFERSMSFCEGVWTVSSMKEPDATGR